MSGSNLLLFEQRGVRSVGLLIADGLPAALMIPPDVHELLHGVPHHMRDEIIGAAGNPSAITNNLTAWVVRIVWRFNRLINWIQLEIAV